MYFNGPNNQTSVKAAVKVRAWKASSLPYPDFTKKEMFISAGSTKGKCLVHCIAFRTS